MLRDRLHRRIVAVPKVDRQARQLVNIAPRLEEDPNVLAATIRNVGEQAGSLGVDWRSLCDGQRELSASEIAQRGRSTVRDGADLALAIDAPARSERHQRDDGSVIVETQGPDIRGFGRFPGGHVVTLSFCGVRQLG